MKSYIVLAGLAFCATSVFGENTLQYFEDSKKPNWYIPPAEGPLIGTQNHWFVTPHDMLPGSLRLTGNVENVTDEGFEITPKSAWGKYTYLVRCSDGQDAQSGDVPSKKVVRSGEILFPDLHLLTGRRLSVNTEVREVLPNAEGFTGDVRFANGSLSCRFDVIKVEDEKRLPDVHSRHYGPHWQHTFDVYYPKGPRNKALPLVAHIHGGGWDALDKSGVNKQVAELNGHGFAVAAINYRFLGNSSDYPAMDPPVAAPMFDSARAIQFIRYHAKELGIDPERVCLIGGSAGGCTALWLGLRDDLADADSDDPISRQSTRVTCVAPTEAQTSLDPLQMQDWIPGIDFKVRAFSRERTAGDVFEQMLGDRDQLIPWITEFSPFNWVSKDDPPVFLNYRARSNTLPPENHSHAVHHPRFGQMLKEKLRQAGVESYFVAKDAKPTEPRYGTYDGLQKFLIDKLKPQ